MKLLKIWIKLYVLRINNPLLRVTAIYYVVDVVQKFFKKIGFEQELVIGQNSQWVYSEGLFLDSGATKRYYKVKGKFGNEGIGMAQMLKRHGIKPRTVVDIGAFHGEISLYFVRNYNSKVLAIEPVSKNIEILKKNCKKNNINLNILKVAVIDKEGFVKMSTGVRGNNKVSDIGEEVPSDTLYNLVKDLGVIDFIKIDIEGSEPLLHDSLKQLLNANRIRSMYIECRREKGYEELIQMLKDNGMEQFGEAKGEIYDLWFIKSSK